MRMKISIPPRPARTAELFDLERTDERFQGAVWDLITAYSNVLNNDDLRHALEEVVLMYYDLNGDGTAGSA